MKENKDIKEAKAILKSHSDLLTDWEFQFLTEITKRESLTAGQEQKLYEIIQSVEERDEKIMGAW